ncbi:hypothetical protein [Helicobacter pylori]|uniref:Uncharacterized protein n=1 Tax=Helicobacter pylori R038b TaxID=1145115 RepID=K2KNI7_HELPX|nr:hypothetical protein [Helicobacter pylori]EKE89518.1 hypothetical protein OUM_1398 [Helicobacter pylori R038b]
MAWYIKISLFIIKMPAILNRYQPHYKVTFILLLGLWQYFLRYTFGEWYA